MTEVLAEYRLKVHGAYRTAAGTVVAGAGAVVVVLSPTAWFAALAVAVAVLVAVLATTRLHLDAPERAAGRATGARLAALTAAGMCAVRGADGVGWRVTVAVTLVAVLLGVLAESSALRVSRVSRVFAAHLPGFTMPTRLPVPVGAMFPASIVVAAAAVPLAWWPALVPVWCVLAAGSFLLVAGNGVLGFVRWRQDRKLDLELAAAVREYDPEFVVYTSRPDDASYQVAMWLPYLRRTGRRFVVVARSREAVDGLVPIVPEPVLLRHSAAALESVITPSLGAVFYVNASSGNNQMVRHHRLTHVYLGHGDSDKPPSYNPTHRMYDEVFAAGPAAIERYGAHGVRVDPARFVVVGRPQVEDVVVVGTPGEPGAQAAVAASSSAPGAGAELDASPGGTQTVLYAPTWRGHVADTALSSLPAGERIVAALLERGVRVVFRPHPFSYEFPEDAAAIARIQALLEADAAASGRAHVWGAPAERERSILQCINESDAMVSDVSSVVSDYLYSRKPFAMVAVPRPAAEFRAEYPIARASYVLDGDLGNLDAVLDGLLANDTMVAARDEVRAHYLGDFPAENYAQHFVDAADAAVVRGQQAEDEPDDGPESDFAVDTGAGNGDPVADLLPAGMSGAGLAREVMRSAAWRTVVQPVLEQVPALVTLALAIAAVDRRVVAVAAGLTVVRLVWRLTELRRLGRVIGTRLGPYAPSLFFVVVALAAVEGPSPDGVSWLLVAAGAATMGSQGVAHLQSQRGVHARHLPGLRVPAREVPAASSVLAILGLILGGLAVLALAVPGAVVVVAVASALAFVTLCWAWPLAARNASRSADDLAELTSLVERYDPSFAVYFAAGSASAYQYAMWESHFAQIGRPYVVVVRTAAALDAIAQLTSAPVIHRPDLRSLDDIAVSSITTVFYVNNAVKNTHMVERAGLHHIWLNHGDSEKPACYNPVHAIYDTIFAAGQAAVDRYARHGVMLPDAAFEIVGRPQVAAITPARGPIGELSERTVLYAPTWIGPYSDTDVYSLPVGADLVRALLARDVRIVFRAHPLNYSKPVGAELVEQIQEILAADAAATGRAHLWGEAAEVDLSVEDCFNLSDAMVCDVSAVVSDYLQSGKPMAIMAMGHDVDELLEHVPAARATYVIPRSLDGLEARLDELLDSDPLGPERDEMRRYYLGGFPADTYADAFLTAARNHIDAPLATSAEGVSGGAG